jgi:hypothetical protein
MIHHRFSLGASLFSMAILFAPVGCSSGDTGSTHFGLKVLSQASGQPATYQCQQAGQNAGDGSGGNLSVAGKWIYTTSHNTTADGTWYDVEITGYDGNVHSWRYDEAQARAGATLESHFDDTGGPTDVQISAVYGACSP